MLKKTALFSHDGFPYTFSRYQLSRAYIKSHRGCLPQTEDRICNAWNVFCQLLNKLDFENMADWPAERLENNYLEQIRNRSRFPNNCRLQYYARVRPSQSAKQIVGKARVKVMH